MISSGVARPTPQKPGAPSSSSPTPTDEQLIGTYLEEPGSDAAQRAAGTLFERHQRRVYLWCLRMVRDHDRALDLAQDALLLAYRSLGSFHGRARFTSWLFAITRNRCLSELRGRPRRDAGDEVLEQVVDPSQRLDDAFFERQDMREVLELMQTVLEPLERRALWLRAYEHMPVDEITRLLDISSASGARGLLQTARRKLRAARRPRGE